MNSNSSKSDPKINRRSGLVVCPECRGKGFHICKNCNENGFIGGIFGFFQEICPDCEGHGRLKCNTCAGMGVILYEELKK